MIDPLSIKPTEHGTWLRSLTRAARELYSFTSGDSSIDVLLRIIGYPYLVTETTVASGGVDSINFTGALGGASAYLIVCSLAPETDNVNVFSRLGNSGVYDAGASDYIWASTRATSGGASADAGDNADSEITFAAGGAGNATGENITALILIINPSGAISDKRVFGLCGYAVTDNSERIEMVSGRRLSQSAFADVQILFSSGQIAAGGRAALYAFPGTE